VTTLPALGRRGEGWVIGQFAWMGLVLLLSLPSLGGLLRPDSAVRSLGLAGGALAILLGGGLLALGVFGLGRQVTPWPRPPVDGHLVDRGIYRRIRHPIYAGAVLLGSGWALATGSLASGGAALGLAVWMDLKARREEAWLTERFPAYAAYRSRSWRFLPGIY
jgi:protein-S-isoprenylcysteine O-methyltransferase Ste14